MTKLILAAAAVLSLGAGSAFARPTIVFTNGSTYDSVTGVISPPPGGLVMGHKPIKATEQTWSHNNGPLVVRFGPPAGGLGG
jgi:hypothetical protein